MQLPSKTKDIVIGQNTYIVTFPNTRQFINIFNRKAQLSNNQYDALSFSMEGNSRYASNIIDAISTFENIMPEQFAKDLNVKNILDLDVLESAEIVHAYNTQYEPWFKEWTACMKTILTPEEAAKTGA